MQPKPLFKSWPILVVVLLLCNKSFSQNFIEPVVDNKTLVTTKPYVNFGLITAKTSGGQLLLNWITHSENSNSHFEIEASKDGENFTPVATTKSKAIAGNSRENIGYHFSLNLSETALAGFSAFSLSLLFLLYKPKKWHVGLLVFIISTGLLIASCSKSNNTKINGDDDIFIRIKQVNKEGTFRYSKIIKAVKN